MSTANTNFSSAAFGIRKSITRLEQVTESLEKTVKQSFYVNEIDNSENIKRANDDLDLIKAKGLKYNKFSSKNDPEKRTLYITYKNIKQRCDNSNHPQFNDYGGRGIQNEFCSFEHFVRTMGYKPFDEYTIDRRDNDGNYCPANCRWADRQTQIINRRPYSVKPGPKPKNTVH